MSNVRDFGASGDGQTDDTEAVLHAIKDGDGVLTFPPGAYRLSRTVEVPLAKVRGIMIEGSGGTSTVVMSGPGPAFRIVGTHQGTGDPNSVQPRTWERSLPTLRNLIIEGTHPEADGIELIETMQTTLEGVLIRRVRHGLRLHRRNRNVLIDGCHFYFNTGVGIFLDAVNLHQINIVGSHISYNRLGGIRIERSEVRNLQITGNDIEYNNFRAHKTEPTPTAEIWIDTTASKATVNEVTIASNTIQATNSPGGANIRIIEERSEDRPPGLYAITGNIIGSQEVNVHLTGCHGVVFSGNTIYSGLDRNVRLEDCDHVSLTGCSFRRHTPQYNSGVHIANSKNVTLTGCVFEDESEQGQANNASLLEIESSDRITVGQSHFVNGVPYGIAADRCSGLSIQGCTLSETRTEPKAKGLLRVSGKGVGNLVSGNILSPGDPNPLSTDPDANVTQSGNVIHN